MNLFTNQPKPQPKAQTNDNQPRFNCGCVRHSKGWSLCEEALKLQKDWTDNLTLKASINYMQHFKNNKIN